MNNATNRNSPVRPNWIPANVEWSIDADDLEAERAAKALRAAPSVKRKATRRVSWAMTPIAAANKFGA